MDDSASEPRAKRQRVDKQGRFAALQQLKECKGKKGKHKLDISEEVDNVYDVVDEKEFAKRNQKYGNDWIEDDGTGYLEDGRDIFDEEDNSGEDEKKSKSKNNKKRLRDSDKVVKGKGSLRNMFNNVIPKKQKDSVVDLAADDVLADILGELDTEKTEIKTEDTNGTSAHPREITKSDAVLTKEYMINFMEDIIRKQKAKIEKNDSSDDEMIERIFKKPKLEETVAVPIKDEPLTVKDEPLTVKDEPLTVKDEPLTVKEEPLTKQTSDAAGVSLSIKTEEAANEDHEMLDIHKKEITEDMDYSILNNDENKFEDNKDEVIPKATDDQMSQIKTEEEETRMLLNNWENICHLDNFNDDLIASVQESTLEESESQLSENIIKFYYWDAWEDMVKRPGEIFLFGKVNHGISNEFKSICVHVEHVDRVLYLLPREYYFDSTTNTKTNRLVIFQDLCDEFFKISTKLGIREYKVSKVTKNFAFHLPGVDVPETCEYVEIRYDAKKSAPDPKRIYNSIAYIFGTNTSFLETFLLERKIKGPCWLNIKYFRFNEIPLSWCKFEAVCSSPLHVTLADDQKRPPPPVSLISIYVRSALNTKTHKNEIVMISCLVNNKYYVDKPAPTPPFNRHFCGVTRPKNQNWPLDFQQKLGQYKSTKVTKLDSERALLSWFLATYQSIDPDLLIGHDVNDLQLDIICEHITALKIPMWSRSGRLRLAQTYGRKFKDFFIGRMICDVKSSAEELIKSRGYDLETLCLTVLKLKEGERMEISNDDLLAMYETSDGLLKLITLTMQDCSYILRLMCEMNVLPLALQITRICGNLMSRTLQGGRSERNEFLLLHAFNEKNYIVPDKKKKELHNFMIDYEIYDPTVTTAPKKKAAFLGGLVLEPIKGYYDKFILLMDFNSLYPSIIQEFNICFTTIPEPKDGSFVPVLPDSTVEQGILPQQIRRLVESRREVKKLMATPDLGAELKMQYNIRQLALKLTANSMYGCLGFTKSRFFAQHLASLVTEKGREILMNTKSIVQKLNFEVIYGDTDSIMVNTKSTDYDQVFKIGHSIKQTVNKLYRQIELDIDGVFKNLLLLKKKKYAAITVTKNQRAELIYKQEHKGLDIVRRDWSQIAVIAGKLILNEILSDNQLDEKIDSIHRHLEKFKQNILNGTVPLPLLTITKQLTKTLREYSNSSNLPHVTVAKRMNDTKNKRYKKGDMVGYIICQDGTENAAMQRAYHLDEIKNNELLKVDTQYYLAQQIHPVVFRLCDPLDGIDGSRISECLGLDPSKFKVAAQRVQRDEGGTGVSLHKTNLQKYRQCEKFTFICVSCQHENIIASAFRPFEKTHIPVLQKCANDDCNITAPYKYVLSVRNQMLIAIRKFIKRFYDNWMVCDEPTCNANTRKCSHVIINNRPVCLVCKQGYLVRSYSERDLYHQISYFLYMFDLSKHDQKGVVVPPEVEFSYNFLKDTIKHFLKKSAYCTINLNRIFKSLKRLDKADV